MSKVGNWVMEMEENAIFAMERGAKTENDVVNYVKTEMGNVVDEKYIRRFIASIWGPIEDEPTSFDVSHFPRKFATDFDEIPF